MFQNIDPPEICPRWPQLGQEPPEHASDDLHKAWHAQNRPRMGQIRPEDPQN